MKKKIKLSLVICMVVVASYFYAHIDQNTYIYNRNADTTTFYGTGILLENQEIAQTFVAQEETIDGINLKISIFGNVENVVLNYCVLDEQYQELACAHVLGNELQNNKFNQLDIPTIENTMGKQYTLVLNVENADEQNGISFYIEPKGKDNYQLTLRDNALEGVLVARIISHGFDVETYVVLLGIIVFVVSFMKVLYKFFR